MGKAVEDLMARIVVQMPAETPVVEAARAMRHQQIGDVLVIDGGQLVGVVTDRDIVVRGIANQKNPATTPLGEIASRDLVIIRPDALVSQALALMRERAVRRLVVMDVPGTLVGVVSIGDIAIEVAPESTLGKISAAPPTS